MPQFYLVIPNTPHVTAYDSDNPTRSTELYCNAVHNIIQDMDDYTTWIVTDKNLTSSQISTFKLYLFTVCEDVFDYAAQAIEDHRAEEEISISKPIVTSITAPGSYGNVEWDNITWKAYQSGMRMLWLIYYLWKTEEDPLLLKEKLQELLIAWPLHDTTIELADDLGQQFKVYPSWKNADL